MVDLAGAQSTATACGCWLLAAISDALQGIISVCPAVVRCRFVEVIKALATPREPFNYIAILYITVSKRFMFVAVLYALVTRCQRVSHDEVARMRYALLCRSKMKPWAIMLSFLLYFMRICCLFYLNEVIRIA